MSDTLMRLHAFPASTASRPVVWFLEHHGIPYEPVVVDLMTGEHLREPYLSLNPAGAVPTLEDDGLVLTETKSILRYLAVKYDSPWYPKDLVGRARVDEAMSYVHAWLYTYLGLFFAYPQAFPQMHGYRSGEAWREVLERGRTQAQRHLRVLETRYLAEGREWLAGGEGPSIADAVGSSVLTLAELVRVDYSAYPRIVAWLERVKALPGWKAANGSVAQLREMFAEKSFEGLVASEG